MVFAGIEINNLSVKTQAMYDSTACDIGLAFIFFSAENKYHLHQERYCISTGKILYELRNISPSASISSWVGGLFNNDDFVRELNQHVEENFL